MDEPARDAAYRRLHQRMSTQDECISWLLKEVRALQARIDNLERSHENPHSHPKVAGAPLSAVR
jgi:hypothetical protein